MPMEDQPQPPVEGLVGTWWLDSRVDRAEDGSIREDPALGSDPLAILTYTNDRFAAQFMKRNRTGTAEAIAGSGQNNTIAQGGYDAYFGTYRVGPDGAVLHRLDAALTAVNVGMEVSRHLSVDADRLVITLATRSVDGEPVTRTLTWHRIG